MDILGEIVKVEKDIELAYQRELKKAQDTLLQVKTEAEKELKYEEEKAESLLKEYLEENRRQAEKKAEEIVLEARFLTEKYKGLTDEALTGIILRHMIRILPEGGHEAYDSQNVQN